MQIFKNLPIISREMKEKVESSSINNPHVDSESLFGSEQKQFQKLVFVIRKPRFIAFNTGNHNLQTAHSIVSRLFYEITTVTVYQNP